MSPGGITRGILVLLFCTGTIWCEGEGERTGQTEIVADNGLNGFYKYFLSIRSENVSDSGESLRIGRSAHNQYAYPYYNNYNNHRRRNQYPPNHEENKKKNHAGIHVANWRWDEIGVFFTFTAFIVVTGLAKVECKSTKKVSTEREFKTGRHSEECRDKLQNSLKERHSRSHDSRVSIHQWMEKAYHDRDHIKSISWKMYFPIYFLAILFSSTSLLMVFSMLYFPMATIWQREYYRMDDLVFITHTGFLHVYLNHGILTSFSFYSLMIIVGVVVGSILFLSGVPEPENEADKVVPDGEFALPTFTPRLFFLILLPPVILESAYSLYDRSFADNLSTILVYAVAGTILNTFIVGPLLYLLSIGGLMGMINLTLTDTIVFAALISAVDPVAVLAIFQEVGVNKDLYYLLFGESLLNDAVTIVLYTTTVTFTEMPKIDGIQYGLAFITFFTVSLGGLVIGIFFGLLTALLTKTTQNVRVVEPLAVLGVAYLSYLAAELFHFSGIISIIGCGLVQAHYALKNISENSRTTVTYFTKMISSTSDAIIFLFLGMVLVSKRHVWHTGFVLWTLFLCLVCRFAVVFSLTALVNIFRVKKINTQEQFIMAYGGLRGAVAFSLVTMLDDDVVISQPIFLTTTLVVILFTVFVQGGTIKLFVNLLNIEKSNNQEKTMNEEINDNIIRTMMAGIEEITGVRGDYYIRRKAEYIDEHYLKKIFLNPTKSNSLTRLYEKLALTQHFAHLYGPVALVEDQKTLILHADANKDRKKQLLRSMSARNPVRPGIRFSELIPGVQLRRRTLSDTTRPDQTQLEANELRTSTEQLRRAFRSNPYSKFNERYDRNLIYEDSDITNMLRQRHLTTQRITYLAALSNRHSTSPTENIPLEDEFNTPRRKIHSELEGVDPEALEGIDAIIDRHRRRVARHSSNVEVFDRDSFSDGRRESSSPNGSGFRSQVYSSLRSDNHQNRSSGNFHRIRTPRRDLSGDAPESQRLIRPLQRQFSSSARYQGQDSNESSNPPSPSSRFPRAPSSSRQSENSDTPDTPTEEIHESKL